MLIFNFVSLQPGPWLPGVPPAGPGGAPPPSSGYGMSWHGGSIPLPITSHSVGVGCTMCMMSLQLLLFLITLSAIVIFKGSYNVNVVVVHLF